MVLTWNNNTINKTIYLDHTKSNTAFMWNIPSNKDYVAFHSELGEKGMIDICFSSEIEENNEEVVRNDYDEENYSLDLQDIDIDSNDENDIKSDRISPFEELLQWHNRLTLIPMKRIQALAHKGILPKRLAKCDVPLCPACVYGKMTCRSWRQKNEYHHITN
jgi:hypothetical protein